LGREVEREKGAHTIALEVSLQVTFVVRGHPAGLLVESLENAEARGSCEGALPLRYAILLGIQVLAARGFEATDQSESVLGLPRGKLDVVKSSELQNGQHKADAIGLGLCACAPEEL
jgi:hypothetical protein